MRIDLKRLTAIGLVSVTVLLAGVIAEAALFSRDNIVAHGPELQIQDPETFDAKAAIEAGEIPYLIPAFPSITTWPYEEVVSSTIRADDQRPVAQLKDAPGALGEDVGVFYRVDPNSDTVREMVEEGSAAYSPIAAIRYRGAGETVYVVTIKPTPAVGERKLLLGGRTIPLANGIDAYYEPGVPMYDDKALNTLAFERYGLIVLVASESLSPSELADYAADVTIEQ